MTNNDQCPPDCAACSVKSNVNEDTMEKNKEFLASISCSHCARWALDSGPPPPAVVRSLEGHRQLLQDIASRRDVPVPSAFRSPADCPSQSNGEGPSPVNSSRGGGPSSTPCPVHVYRSYVGLLRRHLEALRQLALGSAPPREERIFDASTAVTIVAHELRGRSHDDRSDDSGVSSNQSSSESSAFLLDPGLSKETSELEDQGCEEFGQSTDMEIKRTLGSSDLDVKAFFKYERDMSLTALQDEVRRHREFLTQVWSQRRMPPLPRQCHSGDSESALSPFKGAARPMQITDQQLREGSEAVLRALDEALEQSLAEEAEDRRKAGDLSDAEQEGVEQQLQELEDRHQQLQLENLQLRIQLQQRHAELQEERVRLQKQLEEEYRHHQQLQVVIQNQRSHMEEFGLQKTVTATPHQTSNPPSPQTFSRRVSSDRNSVNLDLNHDVSPQKSQTFISLTNDSFTTGSSDLIPDEEEELAVVTPYTSSTTRSYLDKSSSYLRKREPYKDVRSFTTSELNQPIESHPFITRTWTSESIKRIGSKMKGTSSFIHPDTKRDDLDRKQSCRSSDGKRFELKHKRSRSKTEVKAFERKDLEKSPERHVTKQSSWERSPSRDDVQRKLRRKVRSQSVCLPYAHLSAMLHAKIANVKRSLSAGAQNIQRALVALPRRIMSNSSRIVTRVQNWFQLAERGFDVTADEGSITSLPATTRPRVPLMSGRSSVGRASGTSIFGRGHFRNASGASVTGAGGGVGVGCPRGGGLSQSTYAVGSRPLSSTLTSPRQEAMLTLRVEAPPASGRRLQRHLARLSEPEPKEMPALQVEVRLSSGAALGPPVLLRQADAASFYASLLESSSPLPSLSSSSSPSPPAASPLPPTPIASAPALKSSSLVVRRARRRGAVAVSRLPWLTPAARRGRSSVRARRSLSQPLPAASLPRTLIPPSLITPEAAAISRLIHAESEDGPLTEVWTLYRRLWGIVRRLRERDCAGEGVPRPRPAPRRPLSAPLPAAAVPQLLTGDALLVDAVLDLSEGSGLNSGVLRIEDEEENEHARGERHVGAWRGHGNLWLQGYLSLFALLCVLYPCPLGASFDSEGSGVSDMQWRGGGEF